MERERELCGSIQHVRRRNGGHDACYSLIASISCFAKAIATTESNLLEDKKAVLEVIQKITNTNIEPLVASSGLSIQYAIMMGLIHDAAVNHPNKAIKSLYRLTVTEAQTIKHALLKHFNVSIVDLLDGDNDMVQSIDSVLTQIALEDAVPYIIAEIPTNQE
jgi:hypothetical protein